jgi:predicted PurR-regulated permease PerM
VRVVGDGLYFTTFSPRTSKGDAVEDQPVVVEVNVIEKYEPQWSDWARQFVTVALVIAAVFVLTLLTPVIQILIMTFLLAFLLYVPAQFIARETRLNFAGGVLVVYLFIGLFIVLLLVLFVPQLLQAINDFSINLRETYATFREQLTSYTPGSVVLDVFGARIDMDAVIAPLRDLLLGSGTGTASLPGQAPLDVGRAVSIASATIGGLVGAFSGLFSTLFLALFLAFLILLDLPNYQHRLFNAVPVTHRREAMLLLSKINRVWTGFFRGQLTLGILIGVLTWIQLLLMGVAQPVTIAIIVAFISLIPSIGGILALVPLAMSPLLQGSSVFPDLPNSTFAILVVVVNLVWTQIIWNVVAPKIMGEAVSLPLPLIIIGIMLGTAVGGILGAFLVVPMMGTLRVILIYLIKKINKQDPFPNEIAPAVTELSKL